MKMRITRIPMRFTKTEEVDGLTAMVAEIPLPVPHDHAITSHVKFERINDQMVEVFFNEIVWTDGDDENMLEGLLDGVDGGEDDEDEV